MWPCDSFERDETHMAPWPKQATSRDDSALIRHALGRATTPFDVNYSQRNTLSQLNRYRWTTHIFRYT